MATRNDFPIPSEAARAASDTALLAADAASLRRVRAGDREAFEDVVSRHEVAVFRFLLRMLPRPEDAEDAAQETFLKAWRCLGGFDASRPFRPWILAVALNVAREHLRKRGRASFLAFDDVPEGRLPPDPRAAAMQARLEASLTAAQLDRAVAQLPEDARALYHLHYGEELSVDAIARLMEKRPNTVAVALHRLRERLQALLLQGKE